MGFLFVFGAWLGFDRLALFFNNYLTGEPVGFVNFIEHTQRSARFAKASKELQQSHLFGAGRVFRTLATVCCWYPLDVSTVLEIRVTG